MNCRIPSGNYIVQFESHDGSETTEKLIVK
jgi:hypothetical protein